MTLNNFIYCGMNLAPWLVAFGLPLAWRKIAPGWWRYALWLTPTVIVLLGIHSGRLGYWLIAFPSVLLFCAAAGRLRIPGAIAAILISLAISYFPYGLLQSTKLAPISYVFYRSTPRVALDLESSQRKLDHILLQLAQSAAPRAFVCARDVPEAPNIRTVTYDFTYVNWMLPSAAPPGRSIWLFDQHGPSSQLSNRTWRQIASDDLWSLWETTSPEPPAPSP
jgi:hypothetical protein